MDIHAIRRANLRAIIDDEFEGSLAEFARYMGVESSYISRYYSTKSQQRNIGNQTARKIERLLKKPFGWMDQIHGETQAALPTAPKLSKETLKIAQDWSSLSKSNRKAVREMINALEKQKGGKRT